MKKFWADLALVLGLLAAIVWALSLVWAAVQVVMFAVSLLPWWLTASGVVGLAWVLCRLRTSTVRVLAEEATR